MENHAARAFPAPPAGASGWPWMGPAPGFPPLMPSGAPWPKISVVTPNHNYARYLEATLRSVLVQGYPNLEYIVVDDGSTDGSRDIIRKYEPWIARFMPQENRGQAAAINRGMRESTGEILAWLNSDDMYLPWTFRTVAEIFASLPQAEWLVGQNSWWDAEGRQIAVKRVHRNVFNYLAGDYGWIQQESSFWRRSLWEKAGGALDERFRFQIDGELWCRFFRHAEPWHADPVLAGFRHHGVNRSKQNWDGTVAEMERATAALRDAAPAGARRRARVLSLLRRAGRILPWIDVDRIARSLLPALYRHADYRRAVFIDGKWAPGSAPFRFGDWRPGVRHWHSAV